MRNFGRKSALSLSAVLPVLFLGFQSPWAQAQETEKQDPKIYKCKQCVKYVGWRGYLDFGLSYVSDDSYRFGDYRGLEEKGFYAALDGDLHYKNLQGRYFDLYARNLGYDSRQLEMRGGNLGFYELRFAWKEIPKYRGYSTQTPFLGVGSDNLTLPADWVRGRTTGDMTALDSTLVTAPLKTQRKTMDLGLTTQFARNWTYRIDYQRQQKKGSRPFGAGMMFNNATILPAPVDFTTDQFDMDLSWTGRRAQVKFGFFGSYFDNGDSSLTWQNPFSSHPDLDNFRAATAPDNEFYQWNLSAAFAVTPRIRLTGQAAWGELKQNEAFLPYTINPAFSDLPLPRTSLNGKLDTSTFNLSGKLSARLNSKLTFTARGKVDERDNKTPVDEYIQVTTDVVPSVVRYNRPFSYEREQYSADLRFRAHRVIRLSGGAWQKNIDRTLQAIERSEETAWWGEVKLSTFAMSELRIKYESAERDISDYQQQDDGGPTDHPLMRKFNQADRDRERIVAEFDIAPIESLGINLSYFRANSDYDNSEIGLQESADQSWSVNLSYVVGSKLNVYAFYNRDDIDADLINSTGIKATPWNAMTRDRIITGGFGISSPVGEKSSIGFDYVSSDSRGNISVQTTNEEDPFDPLKTRLKNARVHFDHEVNDHWGYKLYLEYEKYSGQDWFIDGLGVDGISSILSMGEQSPDYSVWYIRMQASYRF
jgi:MtrB/PioB family decaheme-associated outer membrane protein